MLALSRAGVIGEPLPAEKVDSSPETQEMFFDVIARSVDTSRGNGSPFTVQWSFADAEPWHVVVDNGSTRAERGLSAQPDVTLETSWIDFVDVGKGAISPPRALLQRKLQRPRRSPRPAPLPPAVRLSAPQPRRDGDDRDLPHAR